MRWFALRMSSWPAKARPAAFGRTLAIWRLRSRARETCNILQKIQRDLGTLSASTEGPFLLVGERLMEVQTRARAVADQMTSIAGLLSDDAGSLGVLDSVLTATREASGNQESGIAATTLHENARSLHQAIENIGLIVKMFNVLGVMTRVESARFEGADATFAAMADVVTALSQQIRNEAGATAGAAKTLVETACGAAERIRQMEAMRQENLCPLTSQAGAELARLREHRTRVLEAAKRIGAQFLEISNAAGTIVAAVQSHDIVRQQIEHVLEALRQAGPRSSNLPEIARLQAAQLDSSRITFESSVQQIRAALAQMECTAGKVAGEAASLFSDSGAGEGSSFSAVGADLAGILSILESNAAADGHVADAARSVHDGVSEISRVIAGVQEIGIQMQRIALNGLIQAVALGKEGATLETVANAIESLARQIEAASATVDNRVKTIRNAASSLTASAAARGNAAAETAKLRSSSESLASMQDKAYREYTRSLAMIADLKKRLRETTNAFGTQEQCPRVLETAIQLLRELSAAAVPAESATLKQPTSRYTMHSERAVHEAVYAAGPDGDALQAVSASSAPATQDVEFF